MVAVAGASGFIGQALGPNLSESFAPISLSRSLREPGGGYRSCRQVDLFSLSGATEALRGARFAVYLVHSMMPAARLVQGHFEDLDVLCADNFARAAAEVGIEHIVYVGGLLPSGNALSEHLRSRQEMERALGATGIPVTTLRCGLVVGARGSSYQLLARLVRRLPLMVCPSWTSSRMQPVALGDVVAAITQVTDDVPDKSRVFDLGAADAVSYRELMAATARSFGLTRRFISVPVLSPGLSRLWVTLTTGAPKALVAPLIQSLRHDMLARPDAKLPTERPTTSLVEMLREAADEQGDVTIVPRAFRRATRPKGPSTVCSVQRMTTPPGRDIRWVADEYFRWLARKMRGLIHITRSEDGQEIQFVFRLTGQPLLGLRRLAHRSGPDREVMLVTEGLLARTTERGRLEFRNVLGDRTLIAALHDFVPRLPWWIYRVTQGTFHRWVMVRFGAHLRRLSRDETPKTETS
uniref:Predicted nucleoside-diphosphate-sugar epimerase n=1 Tax=uncultured bacterium HF186_25m_13D19 TaxID=662888 RepID=C7FPH8_9BACT|nr:predicted nucleoside-diphosphate-sugar epimerase [uncultured bacterium HF186_25m_13D19]